MLQIIFSKKDINFFKSSEEFSIPVNVSLYKQFMKNKMCNYEFNTKPYLDDLGLSRVNIPISNASLAYEIWISAGDLKGLLEKESIRLI